MSETNTSVETTEVADLSPSEEMTEVAEQSEEAKAEEVKADERTEEQLKADARWAEMRRISEEAERRAAEAEAELERLEKEKTAKQEAFAELTGYSENADYIAVAMASGMSEEEAVAFADEQREKFNLLTENETLKAEKEALEKAKEEAELSAHIAKQTALDLAELKKIDPSIKSLNSLGSDFLEFLSSGMDAKHAYFAMKSMEEATQAKPPPEMGMVKNETPEQEFYTEAEVKAMSSDERKANWKKIMTSMPKWR